MKEWAKEFYGSEAWHKARLGYIAHRRAIDGGMCEVCHEQPGFIVHHKIELTPDNINDPNVALNMDNFMYVCKDCHDAIHKHCGRESTDNRRTVLFDREGNPIRLRSPLKRK